MGLFDRFVINSEEQERDRWWKRTDGVDEPQPDDYDEAAQQRHFDEADARGVDYDDRAGYHRYDNGGDFQDGRPVLDYYDDED
jgi:hypothetical protein